VIYSEPTHKASEIAQQTIAELASESIAPNPQNFTIWFDIWSGRNPALMRFIDRAKEKGIEFSPERLREIYSRFIISGNDNIDSNDWNQRMTEVASKITEALGEIGDGTEKYGAALEDLSGNLSGTVNGSDLTHMIADILSETKSMDGQVSNLQTRVQESSDELEAL